MAWSTGAKDSQTLRVILQGGGGQPATGIPGYWPSPAVSGYRAEVYSGAPSLINCERLEAAAEDDPR